MPRHISAIRSPSSPTISPAPVRSITVIYSRYRRAAPFSRRLCPPVPPVMFLLFYFSAPPPSLVAAHGFQRWGPPRRPFSRPPFPSASSPILLRHLPTVDFLPLRVAGSPLPSCTCSLSKTKDMQCKEGRGKGRIPSLWWCDSGRPQHGYAVAV